MTDAPQPGQIWADDGDAFSARSSVLLVLSADMAEGLLVYRVAQFGALADGRLLGAFDRPFLAEDFSRLRLVSTISAEGLA